MAASWCDDAHTAAFNAKAFFIDHRVIFIMGYCSVLNMLIERFQRFLFGYEAVSHLAPEVNRQLAYRCGQLLISPFLVLGYVILIFNAATGCDISELYVFYMASWLCCFDIHEYIRCWPLSKPVLGHHIMAFAIGICFTDLQVFPAPGKPIDQVTLVFLANIGVCWASDFFHVVYRISDNIHVIKRARKIYFCLLPFRLVNIPLLLASAVRSGLDHNWVGMVFPALMNIAYTYNTYNAIRFVCLFKIEQYFATHQAQWRRDKEDSVEAVVTYAPTLDFSVSGSRALSRSFSQAGLRGDVFVDVLAEQSWQNSQNTSPTWQDSDNTLPGSLPTWQDSDHTSPTVEVV